MLTHNLSHEGREKRDESSANSAETFRPRFLKGLLHCALLSSLVPILSSLPRAAQAACTGASPSWTSTVDLASVNTCLNNAIAGDTINIGAGSASWGNLQITKSITLAGAGAGNTVITGTFQITSAAARITGFTWNIGSSPNLVEFSQSFRIDHNAITHSLPSDFGIELYGNNVTAVEGLIDHNTLTNGKVVQFGSTSSSGQGNPRWFEPLNIGTVHAVYVEDNTFILQDASGANNSIDGNWGQRVVVRFNTFQGGRIEQHSLQGDHERAVRLWEIYNNAMVQYPGQTNYRPYFIRGGTGVIFHNTSDGSFTINELDLDNARSSEDSIVGQVPVFGMCDGASFVDQNTSGQQGWACRDQIGRSTDPSLWDGSSNPAPAQVSQPAFIWRNTQPGGEMPVVLSCETAGNARCIRQNTFHLRESRDFYTFRSSFNGTAGVGEGTLANRPATCTTGVGYWATDQGSWNHSGSGSQGVLYQCTAPNTWTLYYTPYTYPHPLQGGTPPPPPPPPPSPCDVNKDGVVNVADVQLEVNMALTIIPCTNPSGTCTVVSVQRVVNAALGGQCVNP